MNAQEYAQAKQVDEILSLVDKSAVVSGLLYDRAVPFADLGSFGGSAGAGVSSPAHWMQAWHELRIASYNNAGMEKTGDLQARAENASAVLQSIVTNPAAASFPIGLIAYSYQQADSLALADGSAYVSGGKMIVGGGTPFFETRRAFVASPLFFQKLYPNTDYVFKFDPAFTKTNLPQSVSYMDVQTEAGGAFRRLYPGQNLTVRYTSPGEKTWAFHLVLSNGETAEIAAEIFVKEPLELPAPMDDCYEKFTPAKNALLTAEYNTMDYGIPNGPGLFPEDPKDDPAPRLGLGDVAIYYGKEANGACKPKLTKPIIFLDGFDHGDERKTDDIYHKYINYTDSREANLHLGTQLRAQGRDIIVLNFPNGTDFVERNAMVLVKLLRLLQTPEYGKDLQEEFVVIGPSMGGLIARYALAYCEKNNIEHNTRLYISYDSPHNGAVIPMGVQQLPEIFKEMGKYEPEEEAALAYNSPAAK